MQDQVKLGLFLDPPGRKGAWFSDSLSIMLAIQSGICCVSGVCVLGWPAIVRDHLTDIATSKCERLAGCGLTDCLFQINGGCLLCGSCLAFLALRIKDLEAKSAIAKFFLSIYVVTLFMIIKDRNAGVYNNFIITMMLPWMVAMSVLFFLAIRFTKQKKDPRSPDPRYPINQCCLLFHSVYDVSAKTMVDLIRCNVWRFFRQPLQSDIPCYFTFANAQVMCRADRATACHNDTRAVGTDRRPVSRSPTAMARWARAPGATRVERGGSVQYQATRIGRWCGRRAPVARGWRRRMSAITEVLGVLARARHTTRDERRQPIGGCRDGPSTDQPPARLSAAPHSDSPALGRPWRRPAWFLDWREDECPAGPLSGAGPAGLPAAGTAGTDDRLVSPAAGLMGRRRRQGGGGRRPATLMPRRGGLGWCWGMRDGGRADRDGV